MCKYKTEDTKAPDGCFELKKKPLTAQKPVLTNPPPKNKSSNQK